MKLISASTCLRHPWTMVSVLAASTLATCAIAPKASAFSLIPRTECEVNVGLPLLSSAQGCDPGSFLFSVRSDVDETTSTRSRLFVDNPGTANSYNGVNFDIRDLGTNPPQGQFWLRPVAVNPNGTFPERGQLEVGTFTLTFRRPLDELLINWFDVETPDTTKVLALNDQPFNFSVPGGANNSFFQQTFNNVRSIQLKLGAKGARFVTGDGVSIQELASVTAIPEPGITFGLGAASIGALLSWRKRKIKSA